MRRQAARESMAATRARRKLAKATGGGDPGPEKAARLSEIVVKRVRKGILSGELVPTIRDGLTAEGLIDKRIARIDDRATALTMAMILSGASGEGPPAHLLIGDGNEVEGEFTETDL